MNKGDKVVCIKDIPNEVKVYLHPKIDILNKSLLFKKGKIYEIDCTLTWDRNGSEVILIFSDETKCFTFTVNFTDTSWKKFDEYFIPLALWRQQQINSILDEGN
jgi:hypothetical protein